MCDGSQLDQDSVVLDSEFLQSGGMQRELKRCGQVDRAAFEEIAQYLQEHGAVV